MKILDLLLHKNALRFMCGTVFIAFVATITTLNPIFAQLLTIGAIFFGLLLLFFSFAYFSNRKFPYNYFMPILAVFLVSGIIFGSPVVTRICKILVIAVAIFFVAPFLKKLLPIFYRTLILNKYYLSKLRKQLSKFLCDNKIRLRVIYEDYGQIFLQVRMSKPINEELLSKFAAFCGTEVYRGDWENFVYKDLSIEMMKKHCNKKRKKPINARCMVVFIGGHEDELERFYYKIEGKHAPALDQ